ncbi:MAG TPA: DHH family phosphoesterase [Patescibacteria group bacterium]|jgi:phosphoesterase RecJ-like protein|nr:DHH family phosphoesterase [Patescibacteria group bacterium]
MTKQTDLFSQAKDLVEAAKKIIVIQAENPDGDSLGSALALEEILGDLGKEVILYCPVNIPKYMGYIKGWDRVVDTFVYDFDLSIIVDTSSATLMERAIVPENLAQISKKPSLVLDHHITESTLPFDNLAIVDPKTVATGELIYKLAKANGWLVNAQACENLSISILADSLGLMTEGTTAQSIHTVAELVEGGAKLSEVENRRREFMKKSPEILAYKGKLLERIEYRLDGALALVHIPWEEIAQYSDQYNPSVLVLDEMRLVTNVRVAIALKTYPDGKITGKIRCNPDAKIAETIAGFFGGGGHPYVAGFRTYSDNFEEIKNELIGAVDKALHAYDK